MHGGAKILCKWEGLTKVSSFIGGTTNVLYATAATYRLPGVSRTELPSVPFLGKSLDMAIGN
jgi:hypothetical protein